MSAADVTLAPREQFFTENETGAALPDAPKRLPCPFCGYPDVSVVQVDGLGADGEWFRATCGRCGADARGGETMLEAASEWNLRPGDDTRGDGTKRFVGLAFS